MRGASLRRLDRHSGLSGLLTVGSWWTSSAAGLLLDMFAVEAPLVAAEGVTGASAPSPESKLGFLAAALPQLFIPLVEDDAAEASIFL